MASSTSRERRSPPASRSIAWAVALVSALAAVPLVAAGDANALAASAKKAASEGRYCDALHLYSLTFSATKEPKYLYNAAEVAFAGGDRVKALTLYREVLQKFPAYEKKAKIEERIGELGRALADEGVGNACPEGAPVCGNGVSEGVEKCDDGNNADADGCDGNCIPTGCGNARITISSTSPLNAR